MPLAKDGFKVCGNSKCTRLGIPQPVSRFTKNKSTKDHLSAYCRECDIRRTIAKRAEQKKALDFEITVDDADEVTPLETLRANHRAAAEKQDLRKEHKALIEENIRLHQLLDTAKGVHIPGERATIPVPEERRGEAVACVLLSDWHVEEPVSLEEMHGLNEFNLEIAEARTEKFFQNSLKLAHIQASACDVKRMWCGMLGDIITNHLHDDNKINNLLQPVEAINFALGLISSGIDYWLENSDFDFDFDCVCGNHGRTTKFMATSKPGATSLETFLYGALAARYASNPRVSFRVAAGAMAYREYFNFRMRLIHGYEIGYQGGVGGVTVPIRKKIAKWDQGIRADLTCMGHFHQLLNGGDHIVNGSLIGYNTYARMIGASPEPARQAFFLIHSRNGGELSATAPVWLDGNY